jgi:RNA polymerase sigma factor (sigma-70 family)
MESVTSGPGTSRHPLVARAIAGDDDAFRALIEPYVAAALGASAIIVGSRDEAFDVVQEATLAAWQGLPRLREPDAFPAWFRRLVIRTAMKRVRGRRNVVELDPTIAAPGGDLDAAYESRMLGRAFARLDPKDRLVLTLRHFWDLPIEEAAVLIDIPPGTVKSRTYHAMERLRAAYAAEERR